MKCGHKCFTVVTFCFVRNVYEMVVLLLVLFSRTNVTVRHRHGHGDGGGVFGLKVELQGTTALGFNNFKRLTGLIDDDLRPFRLAVCGEVIL